MGSKKKSKATKSKSQVRSKLNSIKWINKFSFTFLGFIIWISFFDNHNLIEQNKVQKAIENLEEQKEQYLVKLDEAQRQEKDLSENMEKLAREKYNFAHRNEDVFIIEPENKK